MKDNDTMAFPKRINRLFYQIILVTFSLLLALTFSAAQAAQTKVEDLPKEAIKAMYLAQQALQGKKYDEAVTALTEYMKMAKERGLF